jgi:predicted transcriptional regulator of viral defense system
MFSLFKKAELYAVSFTKHYTNGEHIPHTVYVAAKSKAKAAKLVAKQFAVLPNDVFGVDEPQPYIITYKAETMFLRSEKQKAAERMALRAANRSSNVL